MEPSFVCEFAPTVKMIAARARRFSPGRCAVMAIVGIGFAAFVIPGCLWYRLEGVWALYFLLALVWPLYGIFWPEILPMVGFDQKNYHHIYDVYAHTVMAVKSCPFDRNIRIAALLHDIAKTTYEFRVA